MCRSLTPNPSSMPLAISGYVMEHGVPPFRVLTALALKLPSSRRGPLSRRAAHPGPMGSLSSSFIPSGGLRNPPFPSRFIVSDRSSPSRVRFAASRPGWLRADPKDALLTRGKGGCGFGPCGRAERNLSVIPGRFEPQPRGAVTRRAVAQRRSRASGLTRPSAEAIRGF